mmetsp:Transcript_43855/g.171457  ORF Transcript_43855/g.171457 Transcript_43855/m.171457 type:complete len:95 (+) Transcript_43855:386-670(+)
MIGFVSTVGTGRLVRGVSVQKRVAVRKTAGRTQMSVEPVTTVVNNLMIAEGGGMAVTFPAYLAVFLGTLIPIAFLITLYIQSEASGAVYGRDEE